jgi:hypothetical protein
MKVIYIILLLTIINVNVNAQVELIIKDVQVSNLKPDFSDNIINESIENGPHLLLNCVIVNNTDDLITLRPSEAKYYIAFNYKNNKYNKRLYPLAFTDLQQLILHPSEVISFSSDTYIYLGTDLYEEGKNDYTLDLLQTLPTIRFYYNQNDLKITSTLIENIIIK